MVYVVALLDTGRTSCNNSPLDVRIAYTTFER